MTEAPKTISEWEQEFGLYIVDLDGFDTSDPKLYERRYTRDEFESALAFCTVVRRGRPTASAFRDPAFDDPASGTATPEVVPFAAPGATPAAASSAAPDAAPVTDSPADDRQAVGGQDDEPAVSLEGWPSTIPPRKGFRTSLQSALEHVRSGWQAWVDNGDEEEDEADYDEPYDDTLSEADDDNFGADHRHTGDPDADTAIPPLSALAADAKAGVQNRVVRPFAVRWRSRAFRRFFVLFTLPTLAVFLMDALYALLSRVVRVRWYWPALVLATDAMIVFIAPLAPIISGPLYLWYVVLGLFARLVGLVLQAVFSAVPFLHAAGATFGSGPFLNNVTLFGNRLPLYFHFGTALTSAIVWGTVISSVQHLWVSRTSRRNNAY